MNGIYFYEYNYKLSIFLNVYEYVEERVNIRN